MFKCVVFGPNTTSYLRCYHPYRTHRLLVGRGRATGRARTVLFVVVVVVVV